MIAVGEASALGGFVETRESLGCFALTRVSFSCDLHSEKERIIK